MHKWVKPSVHVTAKLGTEGVKGVLKLSPHCDNNENPTLGIKNGYEGVWEGGGLCWIYHFAMKNGEKNGSDPMTCLQTKIYFSTST